MHVRHKRFWLCLFLVGASLLAASVLLTQSNQIGQLTGPRHLTGPNHFLPEVNESHEQVAVFATLVNTEDRADDRQSFDLVKAAISLRCSASLHGSEVPFHLIYGGGLRDRDVRILQEFGWILEYFDDSVSRAMMQHAYKPVYNGAEADMSHRWWLPNNSVQKRRDGWATYFKFFAWRFTRYRKILHMDLDTCFRASPDSFIRSVPDNITFVADIDIAKRMYVGLKTDAMFLSPSEEQFQTLLLRARNGEYVPYTNTDQDILEIVFPPPTADRVSFPLRFRTPPHIHKGRVLKFKNCTLSKVETCQEFSKQCWPVVSLREMCVP